MSGVSLYRAFRALASCQFMHNRTEFLNRFLKTQPTVVCLSFTPQVTAVKTLLSSSVIWNVINSWLIFLTNTRQIILFLPLTSNFVHTAFVAVIFLDMRKLVFRILSFVGFYLSSKEIKLNRVERNYLFCIFNELNV